MTSVPENPQLARKRLRISLRYWREQRVLTQKHVAEALDWSMSKVVRIESGDVRVSMTDLDALLRLYEVSEADEIGRLTGLARAARRRAWYQDYPRALDPGFEYYLSYESSAEVIETFQALLSLACCKPRITPGRSSRPAVPWIPRRGLACDSHARPSWPRQTARPFGASSTRRRCTARSADPR
jgi:transcriptional regulator with XRE-family HTH domain